MALNDVYEVVDKSVLQGQEVLNVYFYQVQSIVDDPDAEDMAAAYIGQVLPLVVTLQESDLLHTEVRVRNLFNPADTHVEAISEPGVAVYGSELLPIFTALGFRLISDNGAVRNGAKRIAGLDEGIQDDGVVTNGGFITQADSVADMFATTLQHGIIDTFVPTIVKRLLVGGSYELPDTLGEAVLGYVVDAVFDVLLTSQVSRKIGVGA